MMEAVEGGHIFHCNLFTAAAVKLFFSFQEGPLLAMEPQQLPVMPADKQFIWVTHIDTTAGKTAVEKKIFHPLPLQTLLS